MSSHRTSDTQQSPYAERSSSLDKGQITMLVLVVLALLASILMLFTSNAAAMKIAILAALWAAVLGLFLVFRYRNEAEKSAAALEQEREMYEERLEREKYEHRSERLELEQDYFDALRTDRDEAIEAMREQLDFMREQLEALTGQYYYEPSTLQASAERIQELEESRSSQGSSHRNDQDSSEDASQGSERWDRYSSWGGDDSWSSSTTPSSRDTAEFGVPVPEEREQAAASSPEKTIAPGHDAPRVESREDRSDWSQPGPEHSDDDAAPTDIYYGWTLSGSFMPKESALRSEQAQQTHGTEASHTVRSHRLRSEPAAEQSEAQNTQRGGHRRDEREARSNEWSTRFAAGAAQRGAETATESSAQRGTARATAPETNQEQERRGRRRADERSGSVSVADLLKNFNKGD